MTSRDFEFRIIGDSSSGVKAVEGFAASLKNAFTGGSQQAQVFKGVLGGTFAGNILSNVVSQAAGSIESLVSEAVAASDATDKFKQTLDFAGLKPEKIDQLTASTQSYADKTVYSLTDIQNITAQLASNGVKDYDKLAEAAGNLNAVAGGNAETYKSVGMVLTQTAGQGKLTAENWNQLSDAIPGASGLLQKALLDAGAYTGNFRDAMKEGEISAEEFNAAILQLGNEPVAEKAATSVKTMEGAVGNLQAAIVGKLSQAFDVIKPFLTGFLTVVTNIFTFITSNTPIIAALGTVLLLLLAPAIWAAVAATAAWTIALLANPITWIILAIAALVAGIVWLVMNWDTATKWVTNVWGGFISWLTNGLSAFGAWWSSFWGAVGRFVSDAWNNWIVSPIRNAVAILQTAIQLGLQFIGNAWNATWSGLGGIVRGVFNGVLGAVEGGVNGAIGLINNMIRGVNAVGGAVGINIGLIPTVRIPRLATGGMTNGPLVSLIGDNAGGQELVTPRERAEAMLERTALAAIRQSAPSGPVRLSREDLDYMADRVGQTIYPLIMTGSQKQIRAALGGG